MNVEQIKLQIISLRHDREVLEQCIAAMERLIGIEVEYKDCGDDPGLQASNKTKKNQPKQDKTQQTKACKKCGTIKSLSEFAPHKECTDGHLGTCRECLRKQYAARMAEKRKDRIRPISESGDGSFPAICNLCRSPLSSLDRYKHHMRTVHAGVEM